MISLWVHHFGQRTVWSLLYFLNYGYYDIWPSLKFIESPFSNRFKDLSWGEWHGMTGLDLARSGKLSDLMLISQRLKKSIGSCAQQYGHWSEQNRIIRDENAFSSCLDCIAILLLPVPHCVREFFYSFTPMKGAYLLPWWQSDSQIVTTPRNYPMSLLSLLTIKICVCPTYFIRTCKDRVYQDICSIRKIVVSL